MLLKVKEVSELAGVSIRALHYYDEICLLVPKKITDTGYRLYSYENLETLQLILFFKELGFSLNDINKMIWSPLFNSQQALIWQKEMLMNKCTRLHKLIDTINLTIQQGEGKTTLSPKEMFDGFPLDAKGIKKEGLKRWQGRKDQ
ncbi:MerR family transcriptional regulator [Halobacillus sp. Marseille-Q1614]|uniref:MerR family transcriptional regulator n=1 Tax=Halobacillus sp. Marseille-Q1614 TaxID=2709134 RepID=UPI00157055BC|nr:MerR family transcriptional regulator [Halobacillus sp. Marseille-Q1614]